VSVTCAITVCAGILQILFGVSRVARAALAVSPVVVHAMLAGIGITIALQQVHVLLGSDSNSMAWTNVLVDRGLRALELRRHDRVAEPVDQRQRSQRRRRLSEPLADPRAVGTDRVPRRHTSNRAISRGRGFQRSRSAEHGQRRCPGETLTIHPLVADAHREGRLNVIGLFYKFASAQALQVDLTGFSAFDSQPALYDGPPRPKMLRH
jgi:hypothetical protein